MRTGLVIVVLAILQMGSALAQPILSDEIVSDALPRHVRDLTIATPAVALAKDGVGIAMAWSASRDGLERVYVARLDRTAHVSGAVRELSPVAQSGTPTDATRPSLAADSSGKGFVIAWLESPRDLASQKSSWLPVYCRLDVNLTPSEPIVISEGVGGAPVIVRSGDETWITAAGSIWKVPPIGYPGRVVASVPAATDIAVVGSAVRLVSSTTRVQYLGVVCTCHGGYFYCPPECYVTKNSVSYFLHFIAPPSTFASATVSSFQNNIGAAVQSDGRHVLVVWFNGQADKGGQVNGARIEEPATAEAFQSAVTTPMALGTFTADDYTVPSIATDGNRFIVAWRTATGSGNHDIVGAVIDRDATITRFPIAISSDDDVDPVVMSIAPGVFLVAYDKLGFLDRRIAGKFISFPTRSRALR